MRPLALLLAAVALGCGPQTAPNLPPAGAFYFPTGVAHLDAPGGSGILYVASSNFDRRFDFGAVTAVNLSGLGNGGLPGLGGEVGAVEDLGATKTLHIQSFAGEMAAYPLPEGRTRLFVPSRGEGNLLQIIEASGLSGGSPALSCLGQPEATDCLASAISLSALEKKSPSGLPRAPEPFGVGVSGDGELFVTHLRSADSPPGSLKEGHIYAASLRADEERPVVSEESFIELGGSLASSVAVGRRHAYLTGRFIQPAGQLVRLVDRRSHGLFSPALETGFRVAEARGIDLSSDERRLYFAGRAPDMLLVAEISGPQSEAPEVRVVHAVPLPDGPEQVRVISRPGRGNLVAVSCSGAGLVVLYDDDAGTLVAQLPVGPRPFGLAVDRQEPGARIFATIFGDGRVAVIDIPDLLLPHRARVVGFLGRAQTCLVDKDDPSCQVAP